MNHASPRPFPLSRLFPSWAILVPHSPPDPGGMRNSSRAFLGLAAVLALAALAGCGVVAAPCRVTSAGLKMVPVAGQVAAAPTDACANAIDPTPTRS